MIEGFKAKIKMREQAIKMGKNKDVEQMLAIARISIKVKRPRMLTEEDINKQPALANAAERLGITPQPNKSDKALVSAQVPLSYKQDFDAHVLAARRYFPRLEMRTALMALLELLEDEDVQTKWLAKLKELQE